MPTAKKDQADPSTPAGDPVAGGGAVPATDGTKTANVAGKSKPGAARSSAAAAKAKPGAAQSRPGAAKEAARPKAAVKPAKGAVKPAAEPVKPAKGAVKPAAEPVRPSVDTAEPADENPLHKKLRLRPEDSGVVIAPPQDDDNPLLPLPEGFVVLAAPADLASHEGRFNYIHVFARDKGDLVQSFALLRDKLAPGGSLWISWIKQSSRGGALAGDLNETIIRRIALTHAMVDVKVAALDRDWSALRLVHRKR